MIISKSNFENNTLEHFILTKETKLVENNYGIPEPFTAKKFEVKNIDLVFVPLLISDEMNYRVGYEKGFNDRFLASCKKDVYHWFKFLSSNSYQYTISENIRA